MSQAEALLNQMARSGMYTASPATEPHIVVGMDRVIVVPDELKRLGVQFDHNIETVTFDCPRYWDDTDMSKMNVYINYERKDGARGQYLADNVSVDTDDETMMHFEWKISKFVTLTDGPIKFNVCTKSIDDGGNEEEHWNSELCEDCYISPGLESGSVIEGAYPDIITQLRTKMDNILNSGMAVDVTMRKVDDELIVNIVAPEGTEEFRIYDGKTPFIGANGNWWIGNEDTGVTARASTDGFMPADVYDPQGKKTDIFQYVIDNGVSAADRQKWDAKSNFSGSYTDLTNKPTLFDGKYSSLSGKPTVWSTSDNYTQLTGRLQDYQFNQPMYCDYVLRHRHGIGFLHLKFTGEAGATAEAFAFNIGSLPVDFSYINSHINNIVGAQVFSPQGDVVATTTIQMFTNKKTIRLSGRWNDITTAGYAHFVIPMTVGT